jgi:hypothetical protein
MKTKPFIIITATLLTAFASVEAKKVPWDPLIGDEYRKENP